MNFRRNLVVESILVILVVIFDNASSNSISNATKNQSENNTANLGAGNPLFLTPLIETGQADSAREKARVTHPEMLDVESYAGYLTVNKSSNSNLFFWFFPAVENPASAPVLLYLAGGPGMSMMFSLLIEHGPFSVTSNESIAMRKASWNKKHNVIYIDSPIGVGWSFTDSEKAYAMTQTEISDALLASLLQFFAVFPSLRVNDFFVTGQSYAGKYIPVLSHTIHEHNLHAKTEEQINLKGMVIANGFTDPVNQLIYGEFLYAMGLVDANGRDEFLALETQARDLILQNKHTAAYEVIKKIIMSPAGTPNSLFMNLTGYDFNFNVLNTDFLPDVPEFFNWLDRADIRRALHVGNNTFTFMSKEVRDHLADDITRSQAHLVASLLKDYRVLVYTGNLDMICTYLSLQNYLRRLEWSGAKEFNTAERKLWQTADGGLAGYIKKSGNLIEVTVRNAGHFPSLDQPERTLELLEKFTGGSLRRIEFLAMPMSAIRPISSVIEPLQ